jgi:hypothetical protein
MLAMWCEGAIVVALGLAILAGLLGLAMMPASPQLLVGGQGSTALDRVAVSGGGALAAPVLAPSSDRDDHRPRARVTATSPQASAVSRPAVGTGDALTAADWEKTGVSFWRRLVASEQRDGRAFLLATVFQRWIPAPFLDTPRSPVVLPSKEG